MAKPKEQKNQAATAVAPVTNTSSIDWGNYQDSSGFDNISQSDLGIPFISILQPKSAEVDRTHKDYPTKKIAGAEAGDIINNVSREVLCKFEQGYILVVPAGYEKIYNEWKAGRNGFVRSHRNAAIVNEVTGVSDKNVPVLRNGNELVETANFYVLLIRENEEPLQAVISMTSTGLKHARHWLNIMTGLRVGPNRIQPPMFSHVYKLSVIIEKKENNSWYGWKVELHDMVKDKAIVDLALPVTNKIKQIAATSAKAELAAPASEGSDEVPM